VAAQDFKPLRAFRGVEKNCRYPTNQSEGDGTICSPGQGVARVRISTCKIESEGHDTIGEFHAKTL